MRIADRIMLALYTLLLAAASLVVVGFAAGLLPLEPELDELRLLVGRWEVIAGACVLFLVSVRLLLAGLGGGPKELTLRIADGGRVSISMTAVHKFVEKAAGQVRGVHNVKARVTSKGDDLNIKLTAGILPEMNVPDTSQRIEEKVKNSVKETIGRDVSNVHIFFNTISYDAKDKQS